MESFEYNIQIQKVSVNIHESNWNLSLFMLLHSQISQNIKNRVHNKT